MENLSSNTQNADISTKGEGADVEIFVGSLTVKEKVRKESAIIGWKGDADIL